MGGSEQGSLSFLLASYCCKKLLSSVFFTRLFAITEDHPSNRLPVGMADSCPCTRVSSQDLHPRGRTLSHPVAVPSPPALALPAEPPSPMVGAERCSGLAQTSGPRGLLWLAYFGCAGRVASMPPLPPERVLPRPKLAPRHVPQGGAAALAAGAGARSQLEGTSSPGWLPGMAQRPRPAEPPRPRPGPEVSWQAGGQGHRWTPGKIIHRGWSCGQRFRCKGWVPTGSQLKPGHQKPPLSTASSSRTFTLQGFLHWWPVTSAQESKGSIPTMLCNICSCQHCLILMPFAAKHSFKPKAHHLHTPTPTSRAVQGNTHA